MLVFHNQNLVVFAIPKTGSSALEAALSPHASLVVQSPPSQRHMNWGAYSAAWAPVIKRAFDCVPDGVAVMRDPVDRLRSWYRYRRLAQFDGTDWSSAGLDFNAFIDASLSETPPRVARIGQQDLFTMAHTNKVQVRHLFDYAQMQTAVDWLSTRLERPIKLAQKNVSPVEVAELDPALLQRLRKARAREFALYDRVAEQGHLVTR